jgi:hypothetical protein
MLQMLVDMINFLVIIQIHTLSQSWMLKGKKEKMLVYVAKQSYNFLCVLFQKIFNLLTTWKKHIIVCTCQHWTSITKRPILVLSNKL